MLAGVSGGARPLWLAEALDLRPGMRVLGLGCGRALSSVFLRREFGAEVWAADLWFDPSEISEPSTRYYRVMTRAAWMPVLIDEVI